MVDSAAQAPAYCVAQELLLMVAKKNRRGGHQAKIQKTNTKEPDKERTNGRKEEASKGGKQTLDSINMLDAETLGFKGREMLRMKKCPMVLFLLFSFFLDAGRGFRRTGDFQTGTNPCNISGPSQRFTTTTKLKNPYSKSVCRGRLLGGHVHDKCRLFSKRRLAS